MKKNVIPCRWRVKLTCKNKYERLYIDLFYLDECYVRSTGYKNSEENRALLKPALDLINEELASGTFQFAKAFPHAPEADKRRFTEKEGRNYTAPPEVVTFERGYQLWLTEKFENIRSKTTRTDYMKAISPHILPYFANMTFSQITFNELCRFFSTRHKGRDAANGLLSARRMKNICIPLADIWEFMDKRMRWGLPSPFAGITDYINEIAAKRDLQLATSTMTNEELVRAMEEHEHEESRGGVREIILFRDYLKVLPHIGEYYRPAIELLVLTGIIASEMAAIRTKLVNNEKELPILWSLKDGDLRNYLKTKSRRRRLPMTKTIKRCLELGLKQKRDNSPFLFRRKTGIELNDRALRDAWYKACDAAGVKCCQPYALRHSFVAYCEIMGIPKSRIIGLMGHADKSMIDKVYGKYVTDLEKDTDDIKDYYGEDFWGN